jgi:CO/xanthine dehydrogenase Mo-binding subunit
MTAIDAAIGTSMARLEALGKAIGRAQFTDDITLPGMLFGAVLGSPYSHARILSYDVSKALAVPGVKAVVTGADIEERYMGLIVKDETALAKDRVRYSGEPVAAVAATSLAAAQAAARLIEIEYVELPAVFSPEEAMAPGAPILHEGYKDYFKIFNAISDGNVLASAEISTGQIEMGWAESDLIVENVYETQAQYHAYLEPVCAIAQVDAEGKVTVWSSTQSVYRTQANISDSLGLPRSRIRALGPRVGGGFGAKSEATVQPIAVLLAQRTGRPVKLVLDRTEDMITMRSRHPALMRVKSGVKRDGTFVAQEFDLLMDGGAYADDSPAVMMFALYFAVGPYRVPHTRSLGKVVYTNKLRAGAFRGFGNPQSSFARESQIDEIAEKLGIDPIELRLKNVMRQGDRWIGGHAIDTASVGECLEKARDACGWTSRRAAKAAGTADRRRGLGVAAVAHICGFLATSAVVRLLEDGTVSVNCGAVDIGQGSDTAIAQMCAGALGLSVDRINIVAPDTDASPYNSGTNASRVTYMLGRAVGEAAEKVKKQIFKHAAAILECDEVDLELRPGGRVGVVGAPGMSTGFLEVSLRAHWGTGGPIIGESAFVFDAGELDPKLAFTNGFLSWSSCGVYTFGAQIIEVEVDELTGKVEVIQVWSAHDVGRAINPGAVEGQIQGGVVQGLGYGLFEEMVWDGGRLANPSFMDYKIPGALDVPPRIDAIIIENPESTHPFGAKGIGEPPIVGVAPAIANAVSNAVGVRIRRLPVTAERVLRGIVDKIDNAA